MSVLDLERIEAELKAIREHLQRLASGNQEQTLFPLPEAAKRLGIGMTKLRELVAAGSVRTVTLGSNQRNRYVSRSELRRLEEGDEVRVKFSPHRHAQAKLVASPRVQKAIAMATPSRAKKFDARAVDDFLKSRKKKR
jgi:hypothetical protein